MTTARLPELKTHPLTYSSQRRRIGTAGGVVCRMADDPDSTGSPFTREELDEFGIRIETAWNSLLGVTDIPRYLAVLRWIARLAGTTSEQGKKELALCLQEAKRLRPGRYAVDAFPDFPEAESPSQDRTWTEQDSKAAIQQGWDLFNENGTYGIERHDDATQFRTDDEAVDFVERMAAEGSELAEKALRLQDTRMVEPK